MVSRLAEAGTILAEHSGILDQKASFPRDPVSPPLEDDPETRASLEQETHWRSSWARSTTSSAGRAAERGGHDPSSSLWSPTFQAQFTIGTLAHGPCGGR